MSLIFRPDEWENDEVGLVDDFDPLAAALGQFSGPQEFSENHGNVSLCSSTLSPFSSTSITVSSLPQATSTPSQEPRPSRYSDPTFRFKPDLPNVFLRLVKTHRRNFSTVSVQGMKKWDNLAQVQSLIRLKYSYALGQSFLLGYMVGNTNVELQSSEDLPGMYLQHEQKNLLTLWAQPANQALKEKDGLQQGKKVQSIAEDELEAIKLQLKEINGPNKFKEEAYFIWAELIRNGKHSSYEEPPARNSFFSKVQEGTASQRKDRVCSDALSGTLRTLEKMAEAICKTNGHSSRCDGNEENTPPRQAPQTNRAELIKELESLGRLRSMGILTEQEFNDQKQISLKLLKRL